MSLQSLYDNISEKSVRTAVSDELPPINNTDVNQYANILSKKSYLNKDTPLLKENISANAARPTSVAAPAAQQRPANNSNITNTFQQIQKKYNSASNQEKELINKILNSLT